MQRVIQIPVDLVIGLNGLIVVFVVSSNTLRERLSRYLSIAGEAAEQEEAQQAQVVDEAGPSESADSEAPGGGDGPVRTLESEP